MPEVRAIERLTWRKYLFYVDMIVWGIFAIAVAWVVGTMYTVGFWEGRADWELTTSAWWRAFIALAFLVGSFAWVFFRSWKNGYIAMRRPF